MRDVRDGFRVATLSGLVFVVLVLLCLGLLALVDRDGFTSVTFALSGVAGVIGGLVAIVLAVVALRVARTAEISQSPEYACAFRAYRAVWELDGLTQSVLAMGGQVDESTRFRVVNVACGADLLMLQAAMSPYRSDADLRADQLRRNLLDGGQFNAALEELRDLSVESLNRLHAGQVLPGRNTFLGFVRKVVREVGMPNRRA